MPELTFYGASDDLIEVEGAGFDRGPFGARGAEEYPGEDATFLVACPDGAQARVRVYLDKAGCWSVAFALVDEDVAAPTGRLDRYNYTVKLVLDVPEGTTVNKLAVD